ncbi:hypothetical protein D3C72_495630 [compost metagenome]
MQVFEIGIVGVQRVGVRAVGVEHQGAVGPGESARGYRPGRYTIGALHIVGQDVAGQSQQGFRRGAGVAVIHGFRQVIDDVHVECGVGSGAVVIDHGNGELLRQIVRAVGGWVGFVVDQGVAVADHAGSRVETGDGQCAAQRSGHRLWETCGYTVGDDGDATDSQGRHAVECGDGERAALGQRSGIRCTAVAEIFLVNAEFAAVDVEAVDDHRIVVIVDLQNEVGGAGVAVCVGDGVGEGVCAIAAAVQIFEIGIAGIESVGVRAVGVQNQGAVSAGECPRGHWSGGYAVSTLHVVAQHVAGQGQQSFRRGACVAVIHGFGQIIDDVYVECGIGGGAVVIDHGNGELLRQVICAIGDWMRFVVDQGVAVADHAGGGVETGDGQCAAQWRGHGLRKACGYTIGDHGDATDSQGRHAVECGDGERAALGQRGGIRCAAVSEVFLVDGEFTAIHVEAVDDHRIVIVVDLQNEVGGAGIAVCIGDGVGEGLCAVAAAVQIFEVRVAGVQRIGVRAVGIQYQGAVSPGESARGNRSGGHAVGALHIVGQDVAGQGQQGFRSGAIGVVNRLGNIVDDVHVQRAIGGGAVIVDHRDGKLLRQIVCAVGGWMRLVVDQGVAVTDRARCGIEPGNRQRAAQGCGD